MQVIFDLFEHYRMSDSVSQIFSTISLTVGRTAETNILIIQIKILIPLITN